MCHLSKFVDMSSITKESILINEKNIVPIVSMIFVLAMTYVVCLHFQKMKHFDMERLMIGRQSINSPTLPSSLPPIDLPAPSNSVDSSGKTGSWW